MKRKISRILIAVVCILCASQLAACSALLDFFNNLGKHVHNYSSEWSSDKDYHWHECQNSGCDEKQSEKAAHSDSDENGECDVCGYALSLSQHSHSYRWMDNGDGTHKQHCAVAGCDEPDIGEGNHDFSSSDVCACGAKKPGEHKHSLTLVPPKAATCTAVGNIAYYTCSGCYELFSDDAAQTKVTLADVVIGVINHQTMENGVCSVCGNIDWDHEGLNLIELSKGTYGYEYLGTMSKGAARQSLYTAIDKVAVALHNDVKKDYKADVAFAEIDYAALGLTIDDALAVWKIYIDDNPLYYWFSNSLAYNSSNIAFYVSEEYLSGAVRAGCNQLIYDKIKEYLNYAAAETSAYQIALAFHDKIITAIDYAYDEDGYPQEAKWAHSVIGVFKGTGAVCEGYAKTFQLLLNVRGVQNVVVNGDGGGEAHEWNLIRLDDGQWYWCDLTWDDTPDYEWGISYNYFCVNDWQGVDWVDGSNQSGEESGLGIGGSPKDCETFLSLHSAYTKDGTGFTFLYDLPNRSQQVYEGVSSELKVRDTFEINNIQYAIAGYKTVQVTKVKALGAVVIPESVDYCFKNYTVISIGVIGGTKLFGAGDVFNSTVTSVTIPSGVVFIWGLSFYDCSFNEITFIGTKEEWNSIKKMSYWKNQTKPMTIHCIGGDINE